MAISNQYLLVVTSEKSSIMTNRKSTMCFPVII